MKHAQTLTNLKKAKTSLQNIITMIEEDKYCMDIIQQNLAVIGLLKSVNKQLIHDHTEHCITYEKLSKDQERFDEKVGELVKLIDFFFAKIQ